jgi:hypothetical protein
MLLKVVTTQLLCVNGTLFQNRGMPLAQYNLGAMYAKGQGVIQDNVYAHMWERLLPLMGL